MRTYVARPLETWNYISLYSRWLTSRSKFKMADVEDLIVQHNMENSSSYSTNLALFTNVTNCNELRQLIVQGKLEAALLNACMVLLIYFYVH